MTFEVEVGDRVRTISVKRHGQMLQLETGGRSVFVDARRVADGALSLLLGDDEAVVPVRSVDVALVAADGPGNFDVHVAGRTIPLSIRPAGAFGRHKRQVSGAPSVGPQRVIAPMPGKIVKVLVKPGDDVRLRQGLIVVEAMKMENELRASKPGRVRDVDVTEGQSVDAGTVLMVVD